jgi:hypothetical protein
MPPLSLVRAHNTALAPSSIPRTAVFASATSGLGLLTLRAISLCAHPFKAYVIGRTASSASFHASVADLPSSTEIVCIGVELSHLAEAQRVGGIIREREQGRAVDLLLLTTGYAPFNSRERNHDNTLALILRPG